MTFELGKITLGQDWQKGVWLGRFLSADGPSVALLRDGHVFDITNNYATSADFCAAVGAGDIDAKSVSGDDLGAFERLDLKWISPIDLQVIKAAGVTFANSALERVIEEKARGDKSLADQFRADLVAKIGTSLRAVKPGSEQAAALKKLLISEGLWSQYLEVAIGPDAEVFTKAPVLSSVGPNAHIGVRDDSAWNNPEPEVVLVVTPKGQIIGASLGNDVNLRDIEGRSALLLGKAKDNRGSCAIGPMIRLFDDGFSLEDVRHAQIQLRIEGQDQFILDGSSNMAEISRDPTELVAQTIGRHHDYPDGFVLFCGTLFAPTQDRDAQGAGFTHKEGDVVTISNDRLGHLSNIVTSCALVPAWTFGVRELYKNLVSRGIH